MFRSQVATFELQDRRARPRLEYVDPAQTALRTAFDDKLS